MSAYVGRTARVTSLADTDWQGCPVVWIDIDQGDNRWRVRDLVVME